MYIVYVPLMNGRQLTSLSFFLQPKLLPMSTTNIIFKCFKKDPLVKHVFFILITLKKKRFLMCLFSSVVLKLYYKLNERLVEFCLLFQYVLLYFPTYSVFRIQQPYKNSSIFNYSSLLQIFLHNHERCLISVDIEPINNNVDRQILPLN